SAIICSSAADCGCGSVWDRTLGHFHFVSTRTPIYCNDAVPFTCLHVTARTTVVCSQQTDNFAVAANFQQARSVSGNCGSRRPQPLSLHIVASWLKFRAIDGIPIVRNIVVGLSRFRQAASKCFHGIPYVSISITFSCIGPDCKTRIESTFNRPRFGFRSTPQYDAILSPYSSLKFFQITPSAWHASKTRISPAA